MAFFLFIGYLCRNFPLKLLLISLLLVISGQVSGQAKLRNELDSLKKTIRQSTYYDSVSVFKNGQKAIAIAKKLNDPTEEATIYQYYGNFHYFSYDTKKARMNYAKSLEIAKKHHNYKLINSTKIRLTFMLSDTDLLAAEKEFLILLNEALKNNYIENSIEIYNGLGTIYDVRHMKDQALKYYLKGLKLAEKSKSKYHEAMMLNNIGLLKFNNQQTKEAEKDFTEGVKKLKGLNEDRLSFNLNNNLGLVTKELKNYKKSIQYYLNTVENARKLGFPMGMGVALLNLSDSYFKNKDFELANKYTDSALTLLQSFEQYEYIGLAYLIKASVQREMNNTAKAREYIEMIFLMNRKSPIASNIMLAHEELANIYEKEGRYKQAYFHSNRFHTMNDSINEIANKDQFAQMQVIYGKEKVETELENEKNKNSLLSKENELKQARFRATLTISLCILIIAIGLIYIRHVRLTRQQQQNFTAKLIENIDDERSRIAKDLHDDIGQSLSIIKSKLDLLNKGKINDVIGLDNEVGDVIDHTRNISHFLHPSMVQKLGLERSLVSLIEKTQSNTGIISSLEVECDLENLSLEIQTQIYRVLQECINNTLKHADASALKISIKKQAGEIIVKYQDNGKGFDESSKKSEGIGMLTIRERAANINGKLVISSLKGKGFTLSINIVKNT